ncbi:hypothetical protein B0T16DRAFT_396050 [Cercophora newfieldiana]|uniref:Uncharacterized protein n=1 Tax=Cercophora newfieldiana TaxID=92897 RepID=A0AA39YM57_9PEZI|nr:hypothetical protein B0T16DRAFT_396050 [Cercophora newfieldiana]
MWPSPTIPVNSTARKLANCCLVVTALEARRDPGAVNGGKIDDACPTPFAERLTPH